MVEYWWGNTGTFVVLTTLLSCRLGTTLEIIHIMK